MRTAINPTGVSDLRAIATYMRAKTRLIAQTVGRVLETEIEIRRVQDAGNGRSCLLSIPSAKERGIVKGQDAAQIWVTKHQIIEALKNPKNYSSINAFLNLVTDDTDVLLTIFTVNPELKGEI